jgi:phage virion morphogenesis protein
MARFVIDIDISAWKDAIERLEGATADLRPVWKSLSSLLVGSIDRQFRSQGTRFGPRWKPLSPRYAKWKQRHGYGENILKMKGALRNSITADIKPESLVVGSNLIYANVHQFGATIRRKTRRARLAEAALKKPLRISDRFRVRLQERAKERGSVLTVIPARPYLPPDGLIDEDSEMAAGALIHHLKRRLFGGDS